MAFNRSSFATKRDRNEDSLAPVGYINMWLPRKDGTRVKFGKGVPLRAEIGHEAKLVEWINADPANLKILLSKLQIDFQPVRQGEDAALDL